MIFEISLSPCGREKSEPCCASCFTHWTKLSEVLWDLKDQLCDLFHWYQQPDTELEAAKCPGRPSFHSERPASTSSEKMWTLENGEVSETEIDEQSRFSSISAEFWGKIKFANIVFLVSYYSQDTKSYNLAPNEATLFLSDLFGFRLTNKHETLVLPQFTLLSLEKLLSACHTSSRKLYRNSHHRLAMFDV